MKAAEPKWRGAVATGITCEVNAPRGRGGSSAFTLVSSEPHPPLDKPYSYMPTHPHPPHKEGVLQSSVRRILITMCCEAISYLNPSCVVGLHV